MGLIREIDEKEVCEERGYACNLWFACISIRVPNVRKRGKASGTILGQRQITHNTLHDEDPFPAGSAANAFHLHKAIGEDTAECIGEAPYDIERAVSFADIVWYYHIALTGRSIQCSTTQEVLDLHREYHVASR